MYSLCYCGTETKLEDATPDDVNISTEKPTVNTVELDKSNTTQRKQRQVSVVHEIGSYL